SEAEFHRGKAGDIAARARQARDHAHADRVADLREHDGHGAGRLLQCLNAWGGRGQNDVRRERQKLLGISVKEKGVARCTAIVDPAVAPLRPPSLLQVLYKRGEACLSFRIIGGEVHEHTDAAYPLALRAPRDRPGGRRAAEKRDELAPLHVWMAPAWQEIIWRAAQRSLAVMCPACWCSPGGLLALMGSANRVLIIRTGSMSR